MIPPTLFEVTVAAVDAALEARASSTHGQGHDYLCRVSHCDSEFRVLAGSSTVRRRERTLAVWFVLHGVSTQSQREAAAGAAHSLPPSSFLPSQIIIHSKLEPLHYYLVCSFDHKRL